MSEKTESTATTESKSSAGGDRGERGGDRERSPRPEGRDRGDEREREGGGGERTEGGRGERGGERAGERGGRGGDRGRRGGAGGSGGSGGPGGRRFFRRKKVDFFSVNKIDTIDYKDEKTLRQFIGDRGKILPRRHTGLSAMHQRELKTAIKRARNIALLPFAGD
jgi:small subunit ribosomal protein S18